MRGSEIDDKFSLGEIDVALSQRCFDSFFGFFDRVVRESDDLDRRQRPTRVDFYRDLMSIKSHIDEGLDFGDHGMDMDIYKSKEI